MEFLFGADPEVFVSLKGRLVSGFSLIPGDKYDPHPVENGAVQVDGMALEFNIDPTDDEDTFLNNIQSVVAQLASMVPDHELKFIPVAEFGKDYISAQPYEAKDMGCTPDYDAYTGEMNSKPDGDTSFRTASGHIHIGWSNGLVGDTGHHKICQKLAKELDISLGLPSLLFDSDTKRRELYGKAGCYRTKPYGMEYRVLSNVWVASPDLIRWVFRTAKSTMERVLSGVTYAERYPMTKDVINTSCVESAKQIISELNLEVP